MWSELPVRQKSDIQIEQQITPNLAKLPSKLCTQARRKIERL